jgi:predicted PurR-regulated permease PerM
MMRENTMDNTDPGPVIDKPFGDPPPKFHVAIGWQTIWKVIAAILVTLLAMWAAGEMANLLSMLAISFFFSLALQPAVLWLVDRYEWKRGAAVGVIYLAGFVATVLMIIVLIPAVAQLASGIGEKGGPWLTDASLWVEDTFNVEIWTPGTGEEIAEGTEEALRNWAKGAFGNLVGVATSGIGLIFNLATIAMFTFYFTADAPRFQRSILSHMSPANQQRVGWTWDEAVRQTGGYFYSRMLLMLINSTGFFFTMVLVGMPVAFALPLAVFGGFVSVFIPAVGTYIGGAIPVLLTLAIQGFTAGLIVLGYVLLYQQIENYYLSPKISSKTMTLNGAVAFGAALAGGAIAGPMGAFVALPVAALIISLTSNFAKSHEVVYGVEDPRVTSAAEATATTKTLEAD